jgi:hypothetical protein
LESAFSSSIILIIIRHYYSVDSEFIKMMKHYQHLDKKRQNVVVSSVKNVSSLNHKLSTILSSSHGSTANVTEEEE